MIFRHLLNMRSHPTWVRGLKHLSEHVEHLCHNVAPYVGAWIETRSSYYQPTKFMSHPTWVRGLKQCKALKSHAYRRRTLRGCVD